MYRMILRVAAAMIVAAVIQPATADDASVCAQRTTDKAVADCYADRGMKHDEKGDYDRAIADYDRAIRLDPKNWKLYGLRGEAHDHKGDYDRAIADYDVDLRFEPNYSGGHIQRGEAYFRKGIYNRAIADYDQAIRLNPYGAETYNKRGEAYEAKHDPGHAIADFKQALKIDPSLVDAQRGLERVQASLAKRPSPGAPATADDARVCERQGPNDKAITKCYEDRGWYYFTNDGYDRAIANYDRAIQLDPKNRNLYGLRGKAYAGKSDYDRAIADYDMALQLEPNDSRTHLERGEAYEAKHDLDHAIADFNQALKIDPSLAGAQRGVQRVQALLAKRPNPGAPATTDDASMCVQRKTDKAVADCDADRGLDDLKKGDYERAIADYDRAIRLDPKNWKLYGLRGEAYDRKGDYDRAIADYDVDLRFEPNYSGGLVQRGEAYFRKGDYDRAIADYDRAIRLNAYGDDTYNKRGEAYEAKHDLRHAITDFNHALKLNPSLVVAQHALERAQALMAHRPNPSASADKVAGPVNVAPPGRRIALVIGMSAYANVPQLRNPVSDARAMADTFRRLGFAEVIEREDLTRARLEETLKDFGDKTTGADWAVIYYAGHGIEMNGENYLVPVDAKLARAEHVEDEAVALKRVLAKAETARKLRMVILDACRNNPFPMAAAEGRSRAIGRGLSPVEPTRGLLVAYASRDGTTADDGDNGHSPFTESLLTYLETPDLDIGLMFRKVRDQVLARTNNAQEPFTYGSLPGEELYFKQAAAR